MLLIEFLVAMSIFSINVGDCLPSTLIELVFTIVPMGSNSLAGEMMILPKIEDM